jgi:hypothetical protein
MKAPEQLVETGVSEIKAKLGTLYTHHSFTGSNGRLVKLRDQDG